MSIVVDGWKYDSAALVKWRLLDIGQGMSMSRDRFDMALIGCTWRQRSSSHMLIKNYS